MSADHAERLFYALRYYLICRELWLEKGNESAGRAEDESAAKLIAALRAALPGEPEGEADCDGCGAPAAWSWPCDCDIDREIAERVSPAPVEPDAPVEEREGRYRVGCHDHNQWPNKWSVAGCNGEGRYVAWCPRKLDAERIAAALNAQAQDGEPKEERSHAQPIVRRHADGGYVWTLCPNCGPDCKVDEFGCCLSCGQDAMNSGKDDPADAPPALSEEGEERLLTFEPAVVAAFVGPQTNNWQGMPVNVMSDGSWRVWNLDRWQEAVPPVPALERKAGGAS